MVASSSTIWVIKGVQDGISMFREEMRGQGVSLFGLEVMGQSPMNIFEENWVGSFLLGFPPISRRRRPRLQPSPSADGHGHGREPMAQHRSYR